MVIANRSPADVLRDARKRDSVAKRTRVVAVVDELKAAGEPITFLGVAKAAGVSNWLVYAKGVREHIEAARKSQQSAQRHERQAGTAASSASLRVDLELARTELRNLRQERDRLKAKVQRGLGQQVEQAGNVELERRICELGDELQQRDRELEAARSEAQRLATDLEAALDEVGGLRVALRQMTRQQNTAG